MTIDADTEHEQAGGYFQHLYLRIGFYIFRLKHTIDPHAYFLSVRTFRREINDHPAPDQYWLHNRTDASLWSLWFGSSSIRNAASTCLRSLDNSTYSTVPLHSAYLIHATRCLIKCEKVIDIVDLVNKRISAVRMCRLCAQPSDIVHISRPIKTYMRAVVCGFVCAAQHRLDESCSRLIRNRKNCSIIYYLGQ